MTPRFVSLALLLCSAVAIVSLLLFGGGAGDPLPVAETQTSPVQEPARPPIEPEPLTEEPPAEEPERVVLPQAAAVAAAEDQAPVADGHERVQGAVVVVDAKGVEHAQEDGDLELFLWKDSISVHVAVSVQAGEFTVDLPFNCTVEVYKAVLGGRHAHVSEEVNLRSQSLEFRATWPASAVLRVVDAASGVDLVGVTVVASNWRNDRYAHPGGYRPEDVCIEDGRSPVELTFDPERARDLHWEEWLWVGAPGYAWEQLTVDYAHPRNHRAELRRGGAIEVVVDGRLPEFAGQDDGPWLRLRRPAGELDIAARIGEVMLQLAQLTEEELDGMRRPTEDEVREMFEDTAQDEPRGEVLFDTEAVLGTPVVLDGLLPGDYVVAVELGEEDSPHVLGEVRAAVQVGVRGKVTVHVEPPAARSPSNRSR